MAEAAVLDLAPPIADGSPETSQVVSGGDFEPVGEEQFEEVNEEQGEPVDEIEWDDPRAEKLRAEAARRIEQSRTDAVTAAENRLRAEAQTTRDRERVERERQLASEAGVQATTAELLKLFDMDPETAPEKIKEIAANLHTGARRHGMDSIHDLGTRFMQANYGQFYMPNEYIAPYQQAIARGESDVAAGMLMETVKILGYREGFQAARQAMEQEATQAATADGKANATQSAVRERATTPSPTPRSGTRSGQRPRTQVEAAQWFNEGRITAADYSNYRRGDNPLPYQ